MTSESRHLSVHIDRPVDEVYAYASDPTHLLEWASGLGSSLEEVEGRWVVDSPSGRMAIAFAPRNEFGILDHDVTLPNGETFSNPMRVIAVGKGSEVVFTLLRQPEMSDEEFESDAATVLADLVTLGQNLERGAS